MSEVEQFIKLQEELREYADILAKATDAVIDAEVSNYPVLIIHQQLVDIGIPIIDKPTLRGQWQVHISTMEEFVTKQLIEMEKVDEFIKIYKDPQEHFCLFVISELGAQFIFMPR